LLCSISLTFSVFFTLYFSNWSFHCLDLKQWITYIQCLQTELENNIAILRLELTCNNLMKPKKCLALIFLAFWSVAKRTSVFDDPTLEIQELTAVIKQDITALNAAVVDLQLLCNSQNESGNISSDTTTHSTTVVDNLKNRLMTATKEFKEVLTTRTEVNWKLLSNTWSSSRFHNQDFWYCNELLMSWILCKCTESKGSWEPKAVVFFHCFKRLFKSLCSSASTHFQDSC